MADEKAREKEKNTETSLLSASPWSSSILHHNDADASVYVLSNMFAVCNASGRLPPSTEGEDQ